MDTNKEKWVLLMVLTLIWGSSFILIKKFCSILIRLK